MLVAAMIGAMIAGAAPAQCLKAGEVEGTERAWYRNADPIAFGGKKYVKYGLPRAGIVEYVEIVGDKDGVPITAEKGVKEREVIYLLADTADCSLQPYQIEPK
jgi:hypothetical protein